MAGCISPSSCGLDGNFGVILERAIKVRAWGREQLSVAGLDRLAKLSVIG